MKNVLVRKADILVGLFVWFAVKSAVLLLWNSFILGQVQKGELDIVPIFFVLTFAVGVAMALLTGKTETIIYFIVASTTWNLMFQIRWQSIEFFALCFVVDLAFVGSVLLPFPKRAFPSFLFVIPLAIAYINWRELMKTEIKNITVIKETWDNIFGLRISSAELPFGKSTFNGYLLELHPDGKIGFSPRKVMPEHISIILISLLIATAIPLFVSVRKEEEKKKEEKPQERFTKEDLELYVDEEVGSEMLDKMMRHITSVVKKDIQLLENISRELEEKIAQAKEILAELDQLKRFEGFTENFTLQNLPEYNSAIDKIQKLEQEFEESKDEVQKAVKSLASLPAIYDLKLDIERANAIFYDIMSAISGIENALSSIDRTIKTFIEDSKRSASVPQQIVADLEKITKFLEEFKDISEKIRLLSFNAQITAYKMIEELGGMRKEEVTMSDKYALEGFKIISRSIAEMWEKMQVFYNKYELSISNCHGIILSLRMKIKEHEIPSIVEQTRENFAKLRDNVETLIQYIDMIKGWIENVSAKIREQKEKIEQFSKVRVQTELEKIKE